MPCCGAMVSNLVSQITCITGNFILTRCLATCELSIIVIGAKKMVLVTQVQIWTKSVCIHFVLISLEKA